MDVQSKRKLMRLVGNKPIAKCVLGNKSLRYCGIPGSMISLVDKNWVAEHFPDNKI